MLEAALERADTFKKAGADGFYQAKAAFA